MAKFIAACVQNTASEDPAASLAVVSDLIRRARDAGAELITTPEMCIMMEPRRPEALAKASAEAEHIGVAAFRELARETGAWLLSGSFAVHCDGERMWNRSYLFAPDGRIVARYSKIHMFDVDLPNGEVYRESNRFKPGEEAVLAELPWGTLGMTICYDLRFPSLYRTLAHGGAEMLSIPSSFTVPTGRAHWHTLMRARAIETGCYIFAPAQVGSHAGNRKTYGHSVVVAPWGEVIADAGDTGPGFVTARIDMAKVAEARQAVPSLTHDRSYSGPTVRTCALPKAAE